MKTTRTVVFKAPRTVAVEEKPALKPGPGQVLIESLCSIISTGTEITILMHDFDDETTYGQYAKYPFEAGYSSIGRVLEVGEGVDEGWIGKRAANHAPHCDYSVTSASSLIPVPDDISDEEAAFMRISEIVFNGLRKGNVVMGESVVIYGAGLLGQHCARLCRLMGARPVICVDKSDRRLGFLPKEDPAILPVNPEREDVLEIVRERTNGRMADVAIEMTGDSQAIAPNLNNLRQQGRFILISSPRRMVSFDFREYLSRKSPVFIGAHGGSYPAQESPDNVWTQARHAEMFFDWVRSGEIDVKALITHRFALDQAQDAYKMLMEDRTQAVGVLFKYDKE